MSKEFPKTRGIHLKKKIFSEEKIIKGKGGGCLGIHVLFFFNLKPVFCKTNRDFKNRGGTARADGAAAAAEAGGGCHNFCDFLTKNPIL